VPRVFEVLSAVKSGIDGPHSGSDHRHRQAEASQHNWGQRNPRGQEYPELNQGNRDPGCWRPEAKEEKRARDGRDHMRKAWRPPRVFNEMRGSAIKQNRARQPALKQETSARPAFGECGKETLQTYSPVTGLMLVDP
jgi:hypothetical protein